MDPPPPPARPAPLTTTASDSQSYSSTGTPRRGGAPPSAPQPHGSDPTSLDADAALLPRHTVVLVQGNARTKPSLVGMRGRVRRAVGLGGWHWLVLENGEHVRLQRNALAVLEPPTGDETDSSDGGGADDDVGPGVALPRVRPRRPPRDHHYDRDGRVPAAPRRSGVRHPVGVPRINFTRLETAALKRYRTFYRLPEPGPNPSKEQLAALVSRHFNSYTVDESKVISMFVAAARRGAEGGVAAAGVE